MPEQQNDEETYLTLFETAKLLRETIESMNSADFPLSPWFENYPRGCCGDTSDLLAKFLANKGIKAEYVCGIRDERSHAWLEYNGWIIDLTADQFEEISEEIVITRHKIWYSKFKGQRRSYNDFYEYNNYNSARLGMIYNNILSNINNAIHDNK